MFLYALEEGMGVVQMPSCMFRLLQSKACRSAVMFGDELSLSEQRRLIDTLKTTRFCFCCAHGRPTVVPISQIHRI